MLFKYYFVYLVKYEQKKNGLLFSGIVTCIDFANWCEAEYSLTSWKCTAQQTLEYNTRPTNL